MQDIIAWVTDNGPMLATAILAVFGAAKAIVDLTPTERDNAILAKAMKPVDAVANFLTNMKRKK